jgi:hypothetical protein
VCYTGSLNSCYALPPWQVRQILSPLRISLIMEEYRRLLVLQDAGPVHLPLP